LRIVRLANFVGPTSGGLRTFLRETGSGYLAAGHDPVLIMPGPHTRDKRTGYGRVITLPGPVLPFSGRYRVLVARGPLTRLLGRLEPDRLEVSDRTTLRWTGTWARRHGVPAMMVSHESAAGLLGMATRSPWADRLADRLNAGTAAGYDAVVATTSWAAEEFERIGAGNLRRVPLGVDLTVFTPGHHCAQLRRRYARDGEVLLVHCGRLSLEKRPDLSLRALAALRRRGVPAVLVVAGDGPLRTRLARRCAGQPVRFIGFVPDRVRLARLLATADVVLTPGPVETFGLAALEALACGTPVVVSAHSALPEVVGPAGVAVPDQDFATGVEQVLARPQAQRRAQARARARQFGWPATVAGFLAAHGVAPAPAAVG
jgi:alpha-1,6-mannosyltransferase